EDGPVERVGWPARQSPPKQSRSGTRAPERHAPGAWRDQPPDHRAAPEPGSLADRESVVAAAPPAAPHPERPEIVAPPPPAPGRPYRPTIRRQRKMGRGRYGPGSASNDWIVNSEDSHGARSLPARREQRNAALPAQPGDAGDAPPGRGAPPPLGGRPTDRRRA